MTIHRTRRGRAVLLAAAAAAAVLVASIAFADDESDRRSYLSDIESRLSSAASELSGVKSDSDDGDIRDAEGYIDQVKDLVSRLNRVKGDYSKAREVVDRYPGYIDKFKRASAALRSMKGYQNSNVTVMKTCQDKNAELVQLAKDFENRNDPEGLEKLPRIASDFKSMTLRFLEEAEKFQSQMEDWKRTVQYFDASDGKWSDVRSVLHREADDIYSHYRSEHDAVKDRCRDLAAGPDHPVVKEVLGRLANSSAGRKEVMENLNRRISEMVDKIKEIPGASSTSAVDQVRDRLDAIDGALQTLERAKGADAKAREIADRWPAIAREARASIEPLRELKEHHHSLDELPGKCKDMESKLDSFISSNGDDSDGIETIPAFATDLGTPVVGGLAKAKDRLDRMKGARDNAQRFSRSDGPWSDVTSAYRSTSTTIYDFFEDRFEETEGACKEIAKTRDHPKVRAALDRLRGKTSTGTAQLEREVANWVAEARATYLLDCKAMEDLWQAYCGSDWEPNDNEPEDRVKQTAAMIQDRMQRAMEPLMDKDKDYKQARASLRDPIVTLTKKRETKAKAEALLEQIVKEESRLARLINARYWRGNNNPIIQFSRKYGDQQHEQMWSSMGCQVPTSSTGYAVFDGGKHKKPDCIIAKSGQCQIWEFKPKSPTGEQEGQAQVSDYKTHVPRYYTEKHRRNEAPDSTKGGMDFLKALRAHCLVGEDVVFGTVDVKYYQMCEKQYVCEGS